MQQPHTPCWRSEGFAEDLPEVAAPRAVRQRRVIASWLLAAPLALALAGVLSLVVGA